MRSAGRGLDRETGRRLAEIADLVCEIWRQPDCGIWEVRSEPLHFTHSKMMCWVALDRATRMADAGWLPHSHTAQMAGGGCPRFATSSRPTAGPTSSAATCARRAAASLTPACC